MKVIRACLILLSLAAIAGVAQEPVADSQPSAEAQPEDAPPAADKAAGPVIPVPYPVNRYEAAWSKNPFLRKTVVIAGPKETFGKDWALNGMAEYDGKIRVTMVNKQTGEYKHVTNQDPPESEYKLIKANFNRNRADASAEIEKSGETATITYDENLTAKPVTINNTQHQATPPGGQPGMPGGAVRPGQQPVRPGAVPVARGPGGVQGVVTPPGSAPGAVNAAGQPVMNSPVPINANQATNAPPTISRRRQLVPAPVIPPQQ